MYFSTVNVEKFADFSCTKLPFWRVSLWCHNHFPHVTCHVAYHPPPVGDRLVILHVLQGFFSSSLGMVQGPLQLFLLFSVSAINGHNHHVDYSAIFVECANLKFFKKRIKTSVWNFSSWKSTRLWIPRLTCTTQSSVAGCSIPGWSSGRRRIFCSPALLMEFDSSFHGSVWFFLLVEEGVPPFRWLRGCYRFCRQEPV